MYSGIGTILNMYFIVFFVNIIDSLDIVPIPEFILFKIIILFIGQVLLNYKISSVIGADSRNGLMVWLVKRTEEHFIITDYIKRWKV